MVIEKGRAISDVCKSLDISEPALRRWVAAAKQPVDIENSRTRELEAELKKIKKENDNLKNTVNVLKKSIGTFI